LRSIISIRRRHLFIKTKSSNEKDTQPKTTSKKFSIFAEALIMPESKKRHNLLLPVANIPIEDSFKNGLAPSGLKENHEKLPENVQLIEKRARVRRTDPSYPSEVLGNSYEYGGKQLGKKAPRHLSDFNISTEGKSIEEMAVDYKDLMETILRKQDLVVRKDGTLDKHGGSQNIGNCSF
jgi:hypothetical protein